MYSIKKLASISWDGLDDMLPAVREAMANADGIQCLEPVYGPAPRPTIIALALLALAAGFWFEAKGPDLPGKQYVTWPAVALGLLFALVFRRFLFQDKTSEKPAADFALLAASLIPAVLILLLGIALFGDARVALAPDPNSGGIIGVLGNISLWLTGLLGIVAAIAISVASLCYSRIWPQALMDLAVRLLTFRIIIWVMSLIMIEVGVIGKIVGAIVEGLLSISIPQWLPDLVDQISYAGLLSLAYLAVIGGTWTVCRDGYTTLLETGHVDILLEINNLLKDDEMDPAID